MIKALVSYVRAACVLVAIFTLLLGGVYPLLVTAVSQILFHQKASGSLITVDNKVIGSALLGQEFSDPRYFWGRPSATTPAYNASMSGASNLSPASDRLLERVNERVAALKKADPKNEMKIPMDLVTASASGLDPHISVAAARYQVARVARIRRMDESQVSSLIDGHTDKNMAVLFGTARVNVLKLNMALDELQKNAAKEKR